LELMISSWYYYFYPIFSIVGKNGDVYLHFTATYGQLPKVQMTS